MGFVSQKLRDSARGQECTLRLPGICQGGTETTVLAHMPSMIGLKGFGMKVPDYWAARACFACHEFVGRRPTLRTADRSDVELLEYWIAALELTWQRWFEQGLLRVAGDEREPRRKPLNKIVPRPQFFRR